MAGRKTVEGRVWQGAATKLQVGSLVQMGSVLASVTGPDAIHHGHSAVLYPEPRSGDAGYGPIQGRNCLGGEVPQLRQKSQAGVQWKSHETRVAAGKADDIACHSTD